MATTETRLRKQPLRRPHVLPHDVSRDASAAAAAAGMSAAAVVSPDRALRIFVSHNTQYKALAIELRMALQALEYKWPLEILLCEEM